MIKYLYFILCLGVLSSCSKTNISEAFIPQCIDERIDLFNQFSCRSPLVTVKEYTFEGQIVYVFDRTDCNEEFLPEVYDAQCKRLGYLVKNEDVDGITFNDFNDSSTFIRIVFIGE